ncbi:MAG: DUF1553 domain-containing protein [Planctomycetes bacterium]|nr:DUF1553 domain-containing protein [Planctomycetota bacterium]
MRSPTIFILTILCILVRNSVANAAKEAASAPSEKPITADERDHWAYKPLKRPAIPLVKNTAWPRNAIDRFILHRIERAGLLPAREAGRVALIRRVSFDLTGLPPTPGEIDAFVNDRSPNAYEKLIERLLASPAYGERWAQMWLDLARFAETDGFEHDKVRKNAWRYRDWVIRAWNTDLPYDRFLQDQFAADQLRPGDTDAADALGFLLCGSDMPDINRQDERRHSFLNDVTATIGAVTLGLQFGCAQCHAHKYDPISQHDFYRLRAFFDPYFEFKRYKPAGLLKGVAAQQVVPASHLMIRGDFQRKGPKVSPAFPRIAVNPQSRTKIVATSNPAQRRASLAKWLTQPDHPLTTRVIVNRLWQAHFGRALVKSASDFGVMGDEPTHPELLDWLATELPRRDWSLKAMHRLLLTSSTYRQASRLVVSHERESWTASINKDPDNDLRTRMTRQRLSGEALRDAMLAASNSLSQRRGGPGVRPPLPPEMLRTLLKNQWPVTKNRSDHRRRSIYLFVRRNLRYPIFDVFDKPDTNASCPRRNRTTTAPQSLLLLNSRFSLDAAKRLAEFVIRNAGGNRDAQIRLAFRQTLGRIPTPQEQKTASRFLAEDTARLKREQTNEKRASRPATESDSLAVRAFTDFCLVLFNLNEFIYID